MKVAVVCRSLLLQKSLEKFLDRYLVSKESADAILSDYSLQSTKVVVRIGMDEAADIKKPFSRSQLFLKIEEMIKKKHQQAEINEMLGDTPSQESLEARLEKATKAFIQEVVAIVKEHHGSQK